MELGICLIVDSKQIQGLPDQCVNLFRDEAVEEKVATCGKKWQKVAESGNWSDHPKTLPIAIFNKNERQKLPLLLKTATFLNR